MSYWSGLNIGEEGDAVTFFQQMLQRPETGVWVTDDEDTYLDWLMEVDPNKWVHVAAYFPRNWWHCFA